MLHLKEEKHVFQFAFYLFSLPETVRDIISASFAKDEEGRKGFPSSDRVQSGINSTLWQARQKVGPVDDFMKTEA